MGGFARRMSYWNAFSKKYQSAALLKLDGGSIFINGLAEASVMNRWTLEGTYKSGLHAVNLSAWDLPVWQEMADLTAAGQIPKEFLNIPLVSANVKAKIENFPAVQRYLVQAINLSGDRRIRVGITGLLSDPEERISRREFQVQEPQAAARQVIEEMRDKTDYRIVMTDMDLGKAISLAVLVPDINIILVAHNYEAVSEPQQVGGTLIVIPVNEGRMFSEVRLNFGSDPAKMETQTRFVPLDRTVPDDAAMGDLIHRAEAQLEDFRKGKTP